MPGTESINQIGVEHGEAFFQAAMEASDEGRKIQGAMEKMGLRPQAERTQVFTVYSADSHKAIAISVTPFSSDDLSMEGGLSVSQGGHSQGVVVEMASKTRLVGFTHLAIADGEVRSERFDTKRLQSSRAKGLANEAGKIKTARPLVELTVREVASISSLSFNTLLNDSFARQVHSKSEIAALRGNTTIVSEISRFVLLRTSGSACCSCSTSCWGSCSSSCSYGG